MLLQAVDCDRSVRRNGDDMLQGISQIVDLAADRGRVGISVNTAGGRGLRQDIEALFKVRKADLAVRIRGCGQIHDRAVL